MRRFSIAAVAVALCATPCAHATPAATPAPVQTISDADLKKISPQEIEQTIAHRNALQAQAQQELVNAGSAAQLASDDLKTLQGKIDALAKSAAADHLAVQAKEAAILRRDLIISAETVAIALYAVLKFYLRVPFP